MKKYVNNLINESSPYLLQHAHNPVNWYPWGSEALDKAKKEDKPILVSIGYAACHWCHVMERESFENEETAELMNANFINIKIDREERPDLDQIYMEAVQAIAGNGGWPLNVFLTPDAKPFYGGTYFPPQRAFNRTSWTELLLSIKKVFEEQRGEVNAKAEELTNHIGGSSLPILKDLKAGTNAEVFTAETTTRIFDNILKQGDKLWGGFGSAPKFPQTFTINALLRNYYLSGHRESLDQAILSLDKMIAGGIYDHVGGGFARYSTDREWLAPHFEKMLYDNALLIVSLSDAYKLTKKETYRQVVGDTIAFIKRELSDAAGGFYAALDADSEGEEGKYYVWDHNEVKELLGEKAAIFCRYYDISEVGNWEGKNILRTLQDAEAFIEMNKLEKESFNEIINSGIKILFDQRQKRIRPVTDDKIILGWNALMITALCKASAAFSVKEYKHMAEETFKFILKKFRVNNSAVEFHHNYKKGEAKNFAFLDDYAFLIESSIHLQEITSNSEYLNIAKEITEYVIKNFSAENIFYYTNQFQKDIIVRKKEYYDGAIPSGNSVMNSNLLYLSTVFDLPDWKLQAVNNLKSMLHLMTSYPTSFGVWICQMLALNKGIKEIVITGSDFERFRDIILQTFIPGSIIQSSNNADDEQFPLLEGRIGKGNSLIYLCENYKCRTPFNEVDEFLNQLNLDHKISSL